MTNEDLLWALVNSLSVEMRISFHTWQPRCAGIRKSKREGGLIFETFVFTRINEECKAKN